MYSALIADDEPAILNGLNFVINWEEHGVQLDAFARNGAEALRLLESREFDILITDIRMPEMDGLSLIRAIRARDMDVKIIILSGYGEFEYAREAARLGIENYLLKPVSEEELSSTLLSAVEKLEAERQTRRESAMGLEILRETILNRWVMGAIGGAELGERAGMLGFDPDAEHNLVCLIRPRPSGSCADAGAIGTCQSRVYAACRETAGRDGGRLVFRSFTGETVLLFLWLGDAFGYSAALDLVRKCLRVAAAGGVEAAAYMGGVGRGRQAVWENYRRLISLPEPIDVGPGAVTELAGLACAPEKTQQSLPEESYSPLVKRTVRYIREHYPEEISLKTIACAFDVNPAYLGRQFSRETGEMFTAYLNGLRIGCARQLLLETNLRANEIGEKVGYGNQNYFYNTFRKLVGMYPAEYRKTNR